MQVVALADPEGFRSAVLAARRMLNGRGTQQDKERLGGDAPVFGQGKTAHDTAATLGAAAAGAVAGGARGAGAVGGDARVVALLERIGDLLERVVENGSTDVK